jgi:hypothetical protein
MDLSGMLIADIHCSEQTTVQSRRPVNNELQGIWKEADKPQIVVVS